MFNFLKTVKEKTASLGLSASRMSSTLTDMELINDLRDKLDERNDERIEDSQVLYKEALAHIQRYNATTGEESIRESHQAAKKLAQALKFDRSNGEIYFWLAYIFYIFDQDKLAFQYLRTAELLSPDYLQIHEFKKIISA